jgi:hypothetical protein
MVQSVDLLLTARVSNAQQEHTLPWKLPQNASPVDQDAGATRQPDTISTNASCARQEHFPQHRSSLLPQTASSAVQATFLPSRERRATAHARNARQEPTLLSLASLLQMNVSGARQENTPQHGQHLHHPHARTVSQVHFHRQWEPTTSHTAQCVVLATGQMYQEPPSASSATGAPIPTGLARPPMEHASPAGQVHGLTRLALMLRATAFYVALENIPSPWVQSTQTRALTVELASTTMSQVLGQSSSAGGALLEPSWTLWAMITSMIAMHALLACPTMQRVRMTTWIASNATLATSPDLRSLLSACLVMLDIPQRFTSLPTLSRSQVHRHPHPHTTCRNVQMKSKVMYRVLKWYP